MTRVLVAGAGGAIGVHVLADLLAATDWEIVAIAGRRRNLGTMGRRLQALGLMGLASERVTWHTGDLSSTPHWVSETTDRADYILNLAAASDVRKITADPVGPVLANVASTLHLLEFARRVQPKAFLQLSSHEVYGPTFTDDGHTEGIRHRPPNPYAASKAATDDLCFAWWQTYGVPVILANTVNNFGETQRPDKLPVVLQRAIMAGEPVRFRGHPLATRQWVHSRQTARMLRLILQNEQPAEFDDDDGELMPSSWNIAGELLSGLDVAERIADILQKPLILAESIWGDPPDNSHYGLDDTRLWTAASGLADVDLSVVDHTAWWRQTVEWQAANPEWLEEV